MWFIATQLKHSNIWLIYLAPPQDMNFLDTIQLCTKAVTSSKYDLYVSDMFTVFRNFKVELYKDSAKKNI